MRNVIGCRGKRGENGQQSKHTDSHGCRLS
jgi:hypothetical protein